MNDQEAIERWAHVDRLLDRVLALPVTDRVAFVEKQTTDDPRLRDEVLALLADLGTRGDLFDHPATDALSRHAPALDLQPGHRISTYRILGLLGRGGMGDVYRAERADGLYDHQIALKLLRQDAVEHLGLFVSERRILARLEHSGIARLYDAGVTDDGRPYMVMELVEGVPIIDWCRQRSANLQERLALFKQVCDAVVYAHQNLVIHRDLKPGNILVTNDGRAKLLDFGVAKLLSGAMEDATRNTPLTLSYAAPEQLTRAAVSTATDIYALGVLLFELLTERLPWATGQIPVATAIDKILNEAAPAPSAVTANMSSPPVAARLLNGDLDAIVAKALRKEPAHRYATVVGLQADVRRHVHGEPVVARDGARFYVFGRFACRYRWGLAGVAALIITLSAGLAGTVWQAQRAEREAARANATKDFLLSVFQANSSSIASDKPRGEVTARELLDLGSTRIEKEFSDQPDLQIELLGLTAAIYARLPDPERYAAVHNRRMELARKYYGPTHPIVIEGLLDEADNASIRQDRSSANRLLDEIDVLLKTSAQDHSLLRADWWRTKARVRSAVAEDRDEAVYAIDQALALYAKLVPNSTQYARALNIASWNYADRGDHMQAKRLVEQAVGVATAAPERNDALIAIFLNHLAIKYEKIGDSSAAENAYEHAEILTRKTWGVHHSLYWITRASHAQMLHKLGQRERANMIFTQLLPTIPQDWKANKDDTWVRTVYADCLVAEGRARDAIALFEAAHDSYQKQSDFEDDVRDLRRRLGNAYDRAGHIGEARTTLEASRVEYLAKGEPDSQSTLRIRERWGRFLLDHSKPGDTDFTAAESEFRVVLQKAADRPLPESALAHAGLARVLAAKDDTQGALKESRLALGALERVGELYDLRVQPQLWLVHSAVLLDSGNAVDARLWADKALVASRRYDDPSSPAIAEAEAAVRATRAATDRAVSIRR